MKTFADIFSGGGGFSLGAIGAGLTPLWAIESDPEIAEVYHANIGAHVHIKPAQDVDIKQLDRPDLLLASPPCPQWSSARSKKLPARPDSEVGLCILDYVKVLRPRMLIVENVEGWKRSHSFKAIFHGLHELGYWVEVRILNAADCGVPQTRRRLFLRASSDGFLPPLPAPVRRVGWYEAIEDLIDTLPESRFADWQLARLPKELYESGVMVDSKQTSQVFGKLHRISNEPSLTVLADGNSSHWPRAFIVQPTYQFKSGKVSRDEGEPIWTLTGGNTMHGRVKAFITDCQYAGTPDKNGQRGMTIRTEREPIFTLSASVNPTDSMKRPIRAWLSAGRVVAMTPRALARFQSFPDSYRLPDKSGLACRVIGNAVPPLQIERMLR